MSRLRRASDRGWHAFWEHCWWLRILLILIAELAAIAAAWYLALGPEIPGFSV